MKYKTGWTKKSILILMLFKLMNFALLAQTGNQSQSQIDLKNTINVTLGGSFLITGSFPAFSGERLDQYVTRIYTDARKTVVQINSLLQYKDIGFRDITLKRSSGEVLKIDLDKFRLSGDFALNPYLKNDDVVIFAPYDKTRNFFSIEGAVNEPGTFQFVEGDKLVDAIELARGVNKVYDNVQQALIYRLSYDSKTLNTLNIDIKSEEKLKAGDRIMVIANQPLRKNYQVLVMGEVTYPGYIPITNEGATFKDVIDRAGGLLSTAWTKNIRLYGAGMFPPDFLRREFGIDYEGKKNPFASIKQEDLINLDRLMFQRMSLLDESDTAYFAIESQLRSVFSQQTLNFENATAAEKQKLWEIPIKDGDIITVPRIEKVIYVFGQVKNPGRISYIEGKDYFYYIAEAGGKGETGKSNIKVIKSGTKNWVSADDAGNQLKIEPGDYIFVPRSEPKSFDYYVKYGANYLSIVASVATIVLLLFQFTK